MNSDTSRVKFWSRLTLDPSQWLQPRLSHGSHLPFHKNPILKIHINDATI